MTASPAPSIIVFDVNETLLDIKTLEPLFHRLFGAGDVMREWFAQMILYSEAMTLAGLYTPFGTLGAGVLRMLGDIHQVAIQDADIKELRVRMQAMPAHADVPDALHRLRDAGFRLVTLTNSAPDPQANPLERAGIGGWFEQNFSVDQVRRFKPAPETYRMVAEALNVPTASMCLVAAHTWDTLGAQSAGCAAALVARSGNAALPIPELPQPEIVAPDLAGVADQIIQRWR
jgi:2-haloacid dehalogenase